MSFDPHALDDFFETVHYVRPTRKVDLRNVNVHVCKADDTRTSPTKRYVLDHETAFANTLHKAMRDALPQVAAQVQKAFEIYSRKASSSSSKVDLRSFFKVSPSTAEVDYILERIDLSGYSKSMVNALRGEIANAFEAGRVSGAQMLGVILHEHKALEQVHEQAQEWAMDRAAELVGMSRDSDTGELIENPDASMSITETTREDLRDEVENAIEKGLSAKELADNIQSNVENLAGWSRSRAETIARTELVYANVRGNLNQWTEMGAGGKESILADSHDIDDECDDAADEGPVPLDFVYSSGEVAPPYHPRCLCDLVPYTQAEMAEMADNEGAD